MNDEISVCVRVGTVEPLLPLQEPWQESCPEQPRPTEDEPPLLRALRAGRALQGDNPGGKLSMPATLEEPFFTMLQLDLNLLQARLGELDVLDHPERLREVMRGDDICRRICQDINAVLQEASKCQP